MVKARAAPSRDQKLENLIMNHSLIFMGIFEEAFSDIAEKMTQALGAGGAAMAEALGAGSSSGDRKSRSAKVTKKFKNEITPEVSAQIGNAFSEIREEMGSQWPKNASVFKNYVSSPAFDKGIEIVERYDFGRPKITERLSDEILASYVFLVKSGNHEVGKMFKELADWQENLPKPPWVQ